MSLPSPEQPPEPAVQAERLELIRQVAAKVALDPSWTARLDAATRFGDPAAQRTFRQIRMAAAHVYPPKRSSYRRGSQG